MPGFDIIDPLGPDACRGDDAAPCHYWHLKCRALNGERTKLSRRELELVGVDVTPPASDGWRSPAGLYLDETDADPVLKALTGIAQSGLGFLA